MANQIPPANNVVQLTVWSQVKAHILNNLPRPTTNVRVICCVCQDRQLRIVGCYTPVSPELFEEKQGFVLACGHMICEECWPTIHAYTDDAEINNQYKCPLCAGNRDCMLFSTCRCYVGALQIPTRSDSHTLDDVARILNNTDGDPDSEGVPLTFRELQVLGRPVPRICQACYYEDVFGIPELIRYLVANPQFAPYPQYPWYMASAEQGFLQMAARPEFDRFFATDLGLSPYWRCPGYRSGYCTTIHETRPRRPICIPVPDNTPWYWEVSSLPFPAPGQPLRFEITMYDGATGPQVGEEVIVIIPLSFFNPHE